ncbi:MAG: hypothetical protein JJ992_15140, partial [Planctomycetes bacterium]|nr:hypothetical protein [Planctomycetota bacterium]
MSIAWNQSDPAESSHPFWRTFAEAYGLSTLIHVVLLVVLSIFTFVESPFGSDHGLLVNWNSKLSDEALEPDPVQPQEYQPRSGGSQSASVAFLSSADDAQMAAPEARESALRTTAASDAFSSEHMADYVG